MAEQFRPRDLLFSQTTINSTLTRGESIPNLINQISWGMRRTDSDWLPLEIAKDRYDGRWYSIDNRRLYIFRVLERKGLVNYITVRKVSGMRPKSSDAGHTIRFRDGTPTEPY